MTCVERDLSHWPSGGGVLICVRVYPSSVATLHTLGVVFSAGVHHHGLRFYLVCSPPPLFSRDCRMYGGLRCSSVRFK